MYGSQADKCIITPLGVTKDSTGLCDVTMKELNDFLGGKSAIMVGLHKGSKDDLEMDMDIYSVTAEGDYVPAFGCHSTNCKKEKEEGGGRIRSRCMTNTCTMFCTVGERPWCFGGLEGIVNGIGKQGPIDVICDPNGDNCEVNEGESKSLIHTCRCKGGGNSS